MGDSLLRDLRLSCGNRLIDSRLAVDSTQTNPTEFGVCLNLEKDPKTQNPLLITTAEAVCAIEPLKDILGNQKFEYLVDGLEKLWSKYQREELNNRHLGWYCLAMIAANKEESLKLALDSLLDAKPPKGNPWADDENRKHEVYSTWIATWALVSAVEYFERGKQYGRLSELKEAASDGAQYLKECLLRPGGGAAFTREEGNRQRHETQPNPAITAYVLSLLPYASRVLHDDTLFEDEVFKVYDALAGWENRCVWDSYREPYQPGSQEGDFEHFTTCWVARAYWMALSSGLEIEDSVRRKWLWTLAKAVKGLVVELKAEGEAQAGLIYVDRGSLRDYSFAISDVLMLLNEISRSRFPYSQQDQPDDLLERLIKTAEIDILVQDVSDFRDLSTAYASYDVITKRLAEETNTQASKVSSLHSEVNELQEKINTQERDVSKLQKDVTVLRELKSGHVAELRLQFGQGLSLFYLDKLDSAMFVLSILFLGLPIGNLISTGFKSLSVDETRALVNLVTALTGFVCAITFFGAVAYEWYRAFKRHERSLLHHLSVLAGILISITFLVRSVINLFQLGNKLAIAGTVLTTLGGAFGLIAPMRFNWKRHEKVWKKFQPQDEVVES
jgi:hypothetical protein